MFYFPQKKKKIIIIIIKNCFHIPYLPLPPPLHNCHSLYNYYGLLSLFNSGGRCDRVDVKWFDIQLSHLNRL